MRGVYLRHLREIIANRPALQYEQLQREYWTDIASAAEVTAEATQDEMDLADYVMDKDGFASSRLQ